MIPRKLIQVSFPPGFPHEPDARVVAHLHQYLSGWEYQHFNLDQIEVFFKEHPRDEFPNPMDVFWAIGQPAHRADFFRYYYLYVLGGVALDMDAMLTADIESIAKGHTFFTVRAVTPRTVANGYLGCSKEHPLIYQALQHSYTADIRGANVPYGIMTSRLYDIVNGQAAMYEERQDYDNLGYCSVFDGDREIARHYYRDKRVPVTP